MNNHHNHNHSNMQYSSHMQDLSYSEDDDDLVFHDQDEDMDMSYASHTVMGGHGISMGVQHMQQQQQQQQHQQQQQQQHPYPSTHVASTSHAFNYHPGHTGTSNLTAGQSNSNTFDTTDHSKNNKNNSINNINMATTSTPNPSEKIRKKPGRKPGPTCPALRKEQNRAAQRAFRDRKERHLHQLENMIKDLKNQHFLVVSAYQREVHQLKAAIESLQSENYYLREVVFAFESALSKGNHVHILKEVKQELFRRHHESRALAKSASQQASSPAPATPATTATPGTPATPTPATPATPASPSMNMVASLQIPQTATAPSTPRSPPSAMSPGATTAPTSTTLSLSTPHSANVTSPSNHDCNTSSDTNVTSHTNNNNSSSSNNNMDKSDDQSSRHNLMMGTEDGVYSLDGDILYKAPPLFIMDTSEDGKLAAPISPYAPLSVPRPTYRPPGTNLPKHTDYTKHPTVFDELQSSLFPPGTLESLHISMATPQEVVSDDSLFADPLQTEGDEQHSTRPMTSHCRMIDKNIKQEPVAPFLNEIEDDEEFVNKVVAILGLEKESVSRHRLYKELKILAQAEPQSDPNIDPHIYKLPHDRRIDYIPCPKLRAQMIVHQHRYNADEVFQLLVNEAICHGSPLERNSWQLPEAFFDRFGFLLGLELDRIRNKAWPLRST
ncbi:hypothetical protein EDD11_000978 [Mortierella claussenii]|nr:hypothetical protein EDD11_000978 [Mortierella claussenii]